MMPRIVGATDGRHKGRTPALCCLVVLLLQPPTAFAQTTPAIAPAGIHVGRGELQREQRNSQLPESALPYHYGSKLICTECHFVEIPEGAISRRMDTPDPIETCLRCHDGNRDIPDVVMDDVNHLSDRSGGFFSAPGEPNPRGHDLASGGAGVTCIDCHEPHGNGNPRNLKWASDPSQTPPLGLFTAPTATGVRTYERANTSYGTLGSDAMREVTSICIDCHYKFSGLENTGGIDHYTRHPAYDSERSGGNRILDGADGSTAPRHWEDGRGMGFDDNVRVPFLAIGATDYNSAAQVSASGNGVFCLSCHKAHGSSSAYGIVWKTNVPAHRTGCNQCHAIGQADDDAELAQRPQF